VTRRRDAARRADHGFGIEQADEMRRPQRSNGILDGAEGADIDHLVLGEGLNPAESIMDPE